MNAIRKALPQSARPIEIGRYALPAGERLLVGHHVDGAFHVFDWPVAGQGRRYSVGSGFECKAELAALLVDYRRQAKRLGAPPASGEAIERALEIAANGG